MIRAHNSRITNPGARRPLPAADSSSVMPGIVFDFEHRGCAGFRQHHVDARINLQAE